MFTIIEITRDEYEVFEGWNFMDVLIEDEHGIHERSIVEPLISEVKANKLPYTVGSGIQQLKLF